MTLEQRKARLAGMTEAIREGSERKGLVEQAKLIEARNSERGIGFPHDQLLYALRRAVESDARPAPMAEEVKAALVTMREAPLLSDDLNEGREYTEAIDTLVAHIDDLTRKVAETERERDELIADLEACRADLNKSVDDQPGNYIAQGALDYRAAVDGLNKATDAQVWRNPAPDASPPGAPTEGYRVVSTTDFAPPAWDRGVPDALRRFTNALIDAGWPQGATLQAANEHIEGRPLTPLSRPQETDAVQPCPACGAGPCHVTRTRAGGNVSWNIPMACVQPLETMRLGFVPPKKEGA